MKMEKVFLTPGGGQGARSIETLAEGNGGIKETGGLCVEGWNIRRGDETSG